MDQHVVPEDLPDGLLALAEVLSTKEVMSMIERTSRWVDPATFRLMPVWYPEHARRAPLYNENWTVPRLLKKTRHKEEGNTSAMQALTLALGLRSRERPNWSCCHIWGIDDARFRSANSVVRDHRFFSCVANMVMLPTPLKAFTDSMPEVKAMLRAAAFHLYGWRCDHPDLLPVEEDLDWTAHPAWPASWPRGPEVSGRGAPLLGLVPINDRIRKAAERRRDAIRHDLKAAGPHYPREAVRAALDYWKIAI